LNTISLLLATAQQTSGGGGGDAQQPAGCAGGGLSPIIMMGLMFLVFFFLIIRPQQKKAKEHARMLDDLKKGDQVITRGGLIGRVSGVQDNVLFLELQEKVRVRVLKSFVEGRYADPAEKAAKVESKSETASEKH